MSEAIETGIERNHVLEAAWVTAQEGLGYVSWLARDFAHSGVPREDLESEGRLGLLDAALRFDRGHGVQFITYAAWWARRRMQIFAARNGRLVRRPVDRAGSVPRVHVEFSIDDSVGAGNGLSWNDVLADPAAKPPLADLLFTEEASVVARAVDRLPSLWRRIVVLRFGLADAPPLTLQAIGALLGLSRERVRQIEAKSLRRMRAFVEETWRRAS